MSWFHAWNQMELCQMCIEWHENLMIIGKFTWNYEVFMLFMLLREKVPLL